MKTNSEWENTAIALFNANTLYDCKHILKDFLEKEKQKSFNRGWDKEFDEFYDRIIPKKKSDLKYTTILQRLYDYYYQKDKLEMKKCFMKSIQEAQQSLKARILAEIDKLHLGIARKKHKDLNNRSYLLGQGDIKKIISNI